MALLVAGLVIAASCGGEPSARPGGAAPVERQASDATPAPRSAPSPSSPSSASTTVGLAGPSSTVDANDNGPAGSSTTVTATVGGTAAQPDGPSAPTIPPRLPVPPPSTVTTEASVRPIRDPGRDHEIRTTFVDNGVRPLQVGDDATTARSWFVISAPVDGPGPYPLVVVLHGAHSFCAAPSRPRSWPCVEGSEVPNHDGLSWLTEALAKQGFAAVALGINEEYAQPGPAAGDVAASLIVRDVLTAPAATGFDPTRIDRGQVIVVGHSRGGAVASVLGTGPEGDGRPPRLPVPVVAAVLVAPTSDTVDPSRLADRPTAVILGGCDGDSGVDGGEFVSAALTGRRRSPVSLVMIDGATHNAWNDRLEAEAVPVGRPGCATTERLTAQAQRRRMSDLLPELVRSVVGLATGNPIARAVTDAQRADDRVVAGVRVVHIDGAANRRVVLGPAAPFPASGVVTSGLSSVSCPQGISSPYRSPGTEACHRVELSELVGRPATVHLAWTSPGASIRIEGLAAPTVGRRVLVLRLVVDPLAAWPSPLTMEVGAPGSSTTLSFDPAALGPVLSEAGVRRGIVLWSERRVVLPPGTDSVDLVLRAPDAGSLDLVGVDVITAD